MEDFKDRVLDFLDWVEDTYYAIRDFFRTHTMLKRIMLEGCIAIAIGVIAGAITFGVMNHDKKTLAVTKENAAAPVQEQVEDTSSEENIEAGSDLAEVPDTSNVVIEVVDPGNYADNIADWSQEQIDAAVSERSANLEGNSYFAAVDSYWQSRGVTGNARFCTYLFNTSDKVYAASDFEGLSPEVIHIAKNEIYARHGYSFRDANLMNYFMGQIWYNPSVLPADFSEDIFSETEVKNLDLINSIDKM